VDKGEVMTWELRDDNLKDPYQAGGESTYSNNKSIATSYAIIFETFWKQTELYEQSQTYIKMQNEFINIAAHELRTPVQPIIGLSQILLSKRGKIEDHVELIQTISRNAKRLQRLTEDILDVTRIETQSLKLNVERVNLNELISDIIEDQKNEIEKTNKDIRLVHERQDQIIEIDADKNRLTQVISNLLSNAIKFTRDGTIRVTEEVKDSMALVTVMDTGRGIDPEISPRLFLKFAAKTETGMG
jgi:two-component system sensor histidine kinase VicK